MSGSHYNPPGFAGGSLVSGLILGLAFGTKYSGLFALAVPVVLVMYRSWPVLREKGFGAVLRSVLPLVLLIFVVFLIGWLATNPYVTAHPIDFLKDFIGEGRHIARGHGRAESTAGYRWFAVLVKETSIPVMIVLSGCLFYAAYKFRNPFLTSPKPSEAPESRFLGFRLALLLYFIAGFLYLYIFVNMRVARFFFHLWPALVITAAWSAEEISRFFHKKKSGLNLDIPIALLTLVLSSAVYVSNFKKIEAEIEKKASHPAIDAGVWLEKNYAGDKKILAGYDSYVPASHFKDIRIGYNLNRAEIKSYNPDIVVLNRRNPGRYVWKKKGTRLKDLNLDIHEFDRTAEYLKTIKYLFSKGSVYNTVYETNDVVILAKQPGPKDARATHLGQGEM